MNKPSIEELLKIASEGTEEIQDTSLRLSEVVEEFIKHYAITQGEFCYPTYVLYYLFKIEFKRYKKKPSNIEFFRQLSKIAQPYRNGRQRYYKLKVIPQITKDIISKAKRYRGKSEKKENPKV
jgi:hypothetical protein